MTDLFMKSVTEYFNKTKSKTHEETSGMVKVTVIELIGKVNEQLYKFFMKEYSKCTYDTDLVLELTTTGGELTWGYMISQILLRHKGNVTVRVPYYAMSAGTIIALSADQIVLSHCGCLGPIDPYIYGLNVPTSTKVFKEYNRRTGGMCKAFMSLFSFDIVNWELTNIVTNYCEKMLGRIDSDHKQLIKRLLSKYGDKADNIYEFFTNANHHQTPIYLSDIPEELGLNIKEDILLLNKRYKRDNPTTSGTFDFFGKKGSNNNMYTQYSKEMLNTGLDFYKSYLNNKLLQTNETNQQDKNDEVEPISPLSITESESSSVKNELTESANDLVKEVIESTINDTCYDHVRHGVHFDEKESGLVEE